MWTAQYLNVSILKANVVSPIMSEFFSSWFLAMMLYDKEIFNWNKSFIQFKCKSLFEGRIVNLFNFIYSMLLKAALKSYDGQLFYLSFWQVVSVKPQSITRKKDTRHAVALDSENNNIQVKDVVKVIDGPHSVSLWKSL